MTNDSPTALNQLISSIADLFPVEKLPSNWARRAKTKFGTYTMRVFENTSTHRFVSAIYDAARDSYQCATVIDSLPARIALTIKERLLTALKDVKHCGDYGDLYYLANPATAYLVMGDGDGDVESGQTSFEEIEKLLKATGLITAVCIEGEAYPPMEGDKDYDPQFHYVHFGKFGTHD